MQSTLFALHGIGTTWGLYDVVRRSRPHRPALHADHCCASLPLLIQIRPLCASHYLHLRTHSQPRRMCSWGHQFATNDCRATEFIRACLMGNKDGLGLIYWRYSVLWAVGGQRVVRRKGFLSLGVWVPGWVETWTTTVRVMRKTVGCSGRLCYKCVSGYGGERHGRHGRDDSVVDGGMMGMPRRTGIFLARRWDCPGEQLL
ncbi:hypothetical protein B0T18DRAFT_407370, partial [Schizothecium vesticola]